MTGAPAFFEASTAKVGRFELCRDDRGSAFGLHQRPAA